MNSTQNKSSYDGELQNQLAIIKNNVKLLLEKAKYGSYEKFLGYLSMIDNAASNITVQLDGDKSSHKITKYKRILVPYDGSKYSKKALSEAIEISKKFFSTLYIINIVDISLDAPASILQGIINKKLRKLTRLFLESENLKANTMLQQMIKSCKRTGVEVRCEVMIGKPADSILRFAKNHKTDLIIIGSRGLTRARKIMALGSISRKISEESDCPVMIVH